MGEEQMLFGEQELGQNPLTGCISTKEAAKRETHTKIMDFGLRQIEWDHGGLFIDSNLVVDRHNREIVIAYECGKRDAERESTQAKVP